MKLISKAALLDERRRERRTTINRLAQFQADSVSLPRDCTITDISKTGARLFAEGVEVPDRFHLLVSDGERTGKHARRECTVVWRLGGEIGVLFIGAVPRDWPI